MLTLVAPVSASTGHPAIGTYDGTNLQVAVTSVNVTAGGIIVEAVDGATPIVTNGNLTIIFTINSTLLVDFSGAQFDLYMSKNGYSNLTSDDVLYASGFMVSDLNLPFGEQTYQISNARLLNGEGTFDLGYINQSGTVYKMLTGPIPFDITNDYKYIKIFDGSATLIAAAGVINILPAIAITPTWGPGCAEITMTGAAVNANTLYNVTYDADEDGTGFVGQVWSDAYGKFTYVFNAVDLKINHDDDWGERVRFFVNDATTGAEMGVARFIELSREIWNIETETATFYEGWSLGNGSESCIQAHIFDWLWIEGNHWCPTSDVVIAIDGDVIGTFSANATGYFNATGMVIPMLGMGYHNLTVTNNGFFYQYCLEVLPTLIVTPEEGTCGIMVSFAAYGFEANTAYYLYWDGHCYNETNNWYLVMNVTTGADGQFNVSTSYTLPAMYGGPHTIIAATEYNGATSDNYESVYANATFTMLPSMTVTPSTISNDGTLFQINVCGLPVAYPRNEKYDPVYGLNIDNQYVYTGSDGRLGPDACGSLVVTLLSGNFRPGLHTASIYLRCPNFVDIDIDDPNYYPDGWEFMGNYYLPGQIAPVAYATFMVGSEGDPLFDLLDGCCGIIDSIADDIATIKTDVGTLLTNVDALDAKIVALDGDVAAIQTTLGTLQASLDAIGLKVTSINGTTATIETSLGTLQGTVTAMDGDIATIQTDLGAVKTNVASIKGFLPVDMTPIWIAVVLSLVAAVAAIYAVVVIRGKIAA